MQHILGGIQMKKSDQNKNYLFFVFVMIIFVVLYAFYKINDKTLFALDQQEKQLEATLKSIENSKSDLDKELAVAQTKDFIETKARMQDFIMPNDIHFVFNQSTNVDSQFTEETENIILP